MEIRTAHNGPVLLVSLVGKLWHVNDSTALQRTVFHAVQQAPAPAISTVVIDLNRLTFMCSFGLGALMSMYRQFKEKNVELVLMGQKDGVREMIDLSGIGQIIRSISSMENV
jgi:anti-anti-sigma factor